MFQCFPTHNPKSRIKTFKCGIWFMYVVITMCAVQNVNGCLEHTNKYFELQLSRWIVTKVVCCDVGLGLLCVCALSISLNVALYQHWSFIINSNECTSYTTHLILSATKNVCVCGPSIEAVIVVLIPQRFGHFPHFRLTPNVFAHQWWWWWFPWRSECLQHNKWVTGFCGRWNRGGICEHVCLCV